MLLELWLMRLCWVLDVSRCVWEYLVKLYYPEVVDTEEVQETVEIHCLEEVAMEKTKEQVYFLCSAFQALHRVRWTFFYGLSGPDMYGRVYFQWRHGEEGDC